MNSALADLGFDPAAPLRAFGDLPQERLARVAARRAFVEMKQGFMQAAAGLRGASAALLQRQLRIAGDIGELLELSDTLLAVLPAGGEAHAAVQRQLERVFPKAGQNTDFVPL